MNNNIPVTKHRPVLASYLIEHAINLAKKEVPLSQSSIELIGVLAPFLAKIQNNALVPAYTTKPKKRLEDILELVPAGTAPLKEVYWEQCYDKYSKYGAESCSLQELEGVNEYKYVNDLMTKEEREAFEANMFSKELRRN